MTGMGVDMTTDIPGIERPRAPVELTGEPRFNRRVIRLATTSAVALGLIWGLEIATLQAHFSVGICLAAGWILMPALLVASLRWPVVRYGLTLPSTLVSAGLIAICLTALSPGWGLAGIGWFMTTAGVLIGDVLGLWFWLRLAPVPGPLNDPFGAGRWILVATHIFMIVAGLALVALAALLQA